MLLNLFASLIANGPKYFLQGLGVMIAAKYIPNRSMSMKELFMLAVTAALTFFILDQFAPAVGRGARLGAGFGIGSGLVAEPFCPYAKQQN